jgi:hypothetical protein
MPFAAMHGVFHNAETPVTPGFLARQLRRLIPPRLDYYQDVVQQRILIGEPAQAIDGVAYSLLLPPSRHND